MSMEATAKTGSHVAAHCLGKTFTGTIKALIDIDVDNAVGEFVSIVGPSGCGKSTLLKMIAGLVTPTQGTLSIAGLAPLEARRQRQDLAYIFQDATLLPWRTVEKNVALPLELAGKDNAQVADRVTEVLHMVGLDGFARAYPRHLSGGMRMRVSIARALVTQPGLLLLDEPFAALDEITRQRLNEELLRLWEEHGWTGLFVTHNVYEAIFLSQRILVMSDRPGRLLADIAVSFPTPRPANLRDTPEFVHLASEVSRKLRGTSP